MRILLTGTSSLISQSIKSHRLSLGDEVISTTHSGETSADTVHFDLAHYQNDSELTQSLATRPPQALILNAASPTPDLSLFAEQNWDQLDAFLKANIQGNLWILQKTLPFFVAQNFGRIIFISSLNAQIPIPGYSIYATAKSALETTMKYLAAEYGRYNITANSLQLGVIKTERNKKFWRRDSIREVMQNSISLGRLGEPQDVNPILDALLDPSSFIQGAQIPVSGGFRLPLPTSKP